MTDILSSGSGARHQGTWLFLRCLHLLIWFLIHSPSLNCRGREGLQEVEREEQGGKEVRSSYKELKGLAIS